MIQLRKITKDNFEEIKNLKVADCQKNYVSTATDSLAQAWLYFDTAYPFAIYADDLPIGFVMLGYYEPREQYTLLKFFIDEKHQHKGYGRQALQLAVNYLHNNFDYH